jgi:hypothetical protein
MNFGFVKERKASKWLEGYASMLQPFNSKIVSLLANVIPSFSSNKAFIRFMSLIASSWLGPVTIHI